jgi:carbon monoxide dehydrogenase subunit G
MENRSAMSDPRGRGVRRWTPGAGARRLVRVLLLLLGLTAVAIPTSSTASAPARSREVRVEVDPSRGACGVRGNFTVNASAARVWEVLSDYDHIARFVHSVKSSHVERDSGGQLLVRQEAVGGAFIFRRRVEVLLAIQETRSTRIEFHDVLGKDFHSYVGEWRIATDAAGTRVDYELAAKPRGSVPKSFCRKVLKSMARDLLEEVRAEILRRRVE